MSALTDLQAAVAANTKAIDDAIAKLGAPVSGVPEADVAAAAAQIQADAARLAAAPVVTEPAPQ